MRRPHHYLAPLASPVLLSLLAACAHAQEAPALKETEEENAILRERVTRLERRLSDVDAQLEALTERLDDGGGASSVSVGAGETYAPAPAAYTPPQQASASGWTEDPIYSGRSVDLPPPEPEPTPAPMAPAPLAWEPAGGDDASIDAPGAMVAAPARAPDGAGRAAPAMDVDDLYKWAREQQENGELLQAIAGYQELLKRFPRHHLADNALYWTADCHLQRGEPQTAVSVWKRLPLRFPKSPKMPDSLYGMALAHEKMGEPALAETLYSQLVQRYPKAERTREARRALKRLGGAPDAPR